MSIYVLRSRDLYKIGFSSNLGRRVRDLMAAVPGAVDFIGHMPGGMEVEAHLHLRFSDSRFSGEWFTETPELLAFIDICLLRDMPAAPAKMTVKRLRLECPEKHEMAMRVRAAAARAWPETSHALRVTFAAQALGWAERRMKCVYQCEPYTFVGGEAQQIEQWLGALNEQA